MTPTQWPPGGIETIHSCPICKDPGRTLRRSNLVDQTFRCAPGDWTLYECAHCGHWYLDPRPTEATIGLAYTSYYTHQATSANAKNGIAAAAWSRLRNGYLNQRLGYRAVPASRIGTIVPAISPQRATWIRRVVGNVPFPDSPNPRLLDIGCGQGLFVARMQELGWVATGIDVDPQSVATGRALGRDLRLGSVDTTDLEPATFDAVTLDHSIEHLHDPVTALSRARDLLKPGGVISVATPNVASLLHQRFGRSWVAIEAPRHLSLFSSSSLTMCLSSAGFERVRRMPAPNQSAHAYAQSASIVAGMNPFDELIELSTSQRLSAFTVAMMARFQRRRSEELDFVARRPSE